MNKIVDLFGLDVAASSHVDWKRIVTDQHCPYVDKKCFKVRKSQPGISIGTCTTLYGKELFPIMICPSRLLERQQIFVDCLHLLQGHIPGNELHIISEVRVPGGSVDYFLVSALEGKVKDFVGIELQTLDTTGTVWPERQRLLMKLGIDVLEEDAISNKPFGMNWKMTAKTILVQLHHKAQTFENLNKRLVLVLQDRLLDYMKREFNFEHIGNARNSDPMHFHSYSLSKQVGGHRIMLAERHSTDTEGVASSLGLKAEPNVGFAKIVAAIEKRISTSTVFKISKKSKENDEI
ncbi:MAG: NotI family restriction endonuclease [Gammaproteobacteria bacterium]|nr:NotI family restriction endonuclease [Gammaproteobacteria bacterium]